MNNSTKNSFEALKQEVSCLHLSTMTSEGKPNSSYAPFVLDAEGNFYIFVSGLASHTQDLLANPLLSILLMRDEQDTRQIFARQRASYQCDVEVVSNNDSEYTTILDQLEKRFGNVVELLRSLPDFILFRLKPYKGQFVMGFGKAYTLTGKGLQDLEHINPAQDVQE